MSLPSTPLMRRALLALTATALAAMAFATSASAATTTTGEVVLTLKKGAKSSLLRDGVKVAPGSGNGKTRTVKLSVAGLDLATKTVSSGAVLTFSAKGKSVKLRELQLKAGEKSTALSALQGGKRKVFFRLQGAPLEVGTAISAKGPLALTGTGAKALSDALGLDPLSSGKVGSGNFSAFISELKPAPPAPKEEPKGPEGEAYPYASECPVPAVEGNPGFGKAPVKVAGIEPEPLFDAGVSQDVTGTEIDWGFKDSFRSYVLAVPPAGSLQTLDGAVAHPNGTMLVPGSYFEFPSNEGLYEPGSSPDHSDDKLVVEGTGTVLFCKTGHGFNIAMKDPTLTIDGADSRITATVGANMNGTWYPYQRADIANLDLTGVTPEVSDGGNTIVWKDIPAKLSADGELALGAIYPENEALDKVTVKTTLDRPLLTECAIPAGIVETPPAVNFGLTALPTLTSAVTAAGENLGTIDWGVRRATRNSISGAGGTFPLLGGATASHPGNMGGAAGAPPTGGTGKFFRFPISSYSYEAGTADPKDDRLIATSDATVGFCNPTLGNFGVVISKPTLVIDGANSRLIANAYSFAGAFGAGEAKGWIGGRVELVDLDPSTIDAVAAAGKVNWGDTPAGEEAIVNGIPVNGNWQTSALSLANLAEGTGAGGFDPVTAQIVLPTP